MVIEAINLTKIFKDFWHRPIIAAVNNIEFSVKKGEIFGLIGPNGAGKSTTIKLILGLLYPTKGIVRVFGKNPRSIEVKKIIGYMPEESYLYPYLTGYETLDFYASIFGYSFFERKKRVDFLIDAVGLKEDCYRPVKEYSKGMARRIALAQALINDPQLLILDEPTTGLDPVGKSYMKEFLLELRDMGKTIFICSHILSDMQDICDRIAILVGGEIICMGEIDNLLQTKEAINLKIHKISEKELEKIQQTLRQANIPFEISYERKSLEEFFIEKIEETEQEEEEVDFSPNIDEEAAVDKQKKDVIEELVKGKE